MLNLLTFAQSYDYTTLYNMNTSTSTTSTSSMPTGVLVGIIIACIALAVFMVAAMWRIFTKAGKPGWAAIIPIYNYIVLLQIVGRPVWWIFFYLVGAIPFVGWIVTFVVAVIVMNDLAKSYGKGVGYTLLFVFLPIIGYPMLAWGGAKYKGPTALQGAGMGGAGTTPTATPPTTTPTSAA